MSRARRHPVTIRLTTRLTIGELDYASSCQLRQVLRDCPVGPETQLLVDLGDVDVDHDMTLYALLAGRAQAQAGGQMTVFAATARLAHLLDTLGVAVADGAPPDSGERGRDIVVGRLSARPHRTTSPEMPVP